MSSDNGFVGYSKLRKLAEDYEAKAAAIRLTLRLAGQEEQASATKRAGTTFTQALKTEAVRQSWKQAVSPDERARRQALIREVLGRGPLPVSELGAQLRARGGLTVSNDRIRQIIAEMPDVQRTGNFSSARYQLRAGRAAQTPARVPATTKRTARKPPPKSRHPERRPSANFAGTTGEKARTVVGLVRDAEGGVLSVSDLSARAKEAGIEGLAGMVNYLRAGWLRRTRDPAGQTAYRFVKMPPEPEAANQ